MKIIGFALFALLATANSLPQQVQSSNLKDSRVLDQIVNELIKSIVELIKERKLDPYVVPLAEGEIALGGILFASGRVDNFVLSGLSNIVVNSVSFSGSELDIDISLPRIAASVDNVIGDVTIGSRNIQGEFSGRIAIVDLRLAARISLGLSAYLLDDLSLSCQLGGIEADFSSFVLQGNDVTDSVNNFVGNTLPNLLIQYEKSIINTTISEKSTNMKIIGFALFALLATANSLPQQVQSSNLKDSRVLDQIVNELIKSIVELIKERKLDPYVVPLAEGEIALGGILFASGRVDNFVLSGLSNIVVNSVSFSGSELDIDISLPRIAASVDNVIGDVTIGSRNIQGEFSGRIAIVDLRLAARISLGLSAYLLDDLSLSCQLGGIEADFNSFVLQGNDVTDSVNNFVGNTLPNLLIQYENEINRFFERFIISIVERLS
ncbi:uncharacterized protein LOC106707853 [Papilio machaon]|uniref:uncharacterized protein LOC106707853 n=1 Tax=Papilio machaon TaxID=76193 RepID=UPI001E663639|nr:uncharacterized protein LOC106707853 [Papilio machaon]